MVLIKCGEVSYSDEVAKQIEKLVDSVKNAITKNHRLNSMDGEVKEKYYIKINNTNLSAEEVARIIRERFKL